MDAHKNCETKGFQKLSYDGIDRIEKSLKEENIKFKKLGEKKINYLVKFNEIFEIDKNIYLKFKTQYDKDQPFDKLHPKELSVLHISIYSKPGSDKSIVHKLKSIVDEFEKDYE